MSSEGSLQDAEGGRLMDDICTAGARESQWAWSGSDGVGPALGN